MISGPCRFRCRAISIGASALAADRHALQAQRAKAVLLASAASMDDPDFVGQKSPAHP
jgi:hypothetical protein